jgi:hypothetical protein
MKNEFNCGGKGCDDIRCDDCDNFLQYMKKMKETNKTSCLKLAMKEGADIYLLPGGSVTLIGGGGGGGGSGKK